MFITDGPTNYDLVFNDLLNTFRQQAGPESTVQVGFFQEPCVVREDGVYSGNDKLDSIGGILILRYLLRAGDGKRSGEYEWVPYREFKDGSNFAAYIKNRIEDVIAREYSGRKEVLTNRLEALGGKPYAFEAKPDMSIIIRPFPSVPILSVFWDEDDEFPASFQFLFDRSAPSFLDMESLAVLLHYAHLKISGA